MRARSNTSVPRTPWGRFQHDPAARLLVHALRVRARVLYRRRGDPPSLPAAAHTSDVDHQRHLRHCSGRVDHRDRRGLSPRDPDHGCHRAVRVDDQYRQRLPHHRPNAQDVQVGAQTGVGRAPMSHGIVQLAYLVATVLFIFALHWMNTPATARKAVYAGVVAMALAVIATWAQPEVVHHGWIVLAIIAGFVVGVPLSRVPLTAVPQRTALSHAFGGLAAGLVGTAKYYLWSSEGAENLTAFRMVAIIVEVLLG